MKKKLDDFLCFCDRDRGDGKVILKLPVTKKDMTSKSWCYTLNNPTESEINTLRSYEVTYHVMGNEIGENGTPHLQSFIIFKRSYRLSGVKKLSPRAHWEIAKACDAGNYCKKDGDFWELDNRSSGKRTDLVEACDILKNEGIKKLKTELPHVYVKYPRGFNDLSSHFLVRDKPVPVVTWIWGPTGSGKTRSVFEKEEDLWVSGANLTWFDGYIAQKAVLFDDFRSHMCQFAFLLRVLDRYPIKVPIKGGFVDFVPERIYITSCKRPEDVYNKDNFDNEEKVEQLLRRLNQVIYMSLN